MELWVFGAAGKDQPCLSRRAQLAPAGMPLAPRSPLALPCLTHRALPIRVGRIGMHRRWFVHEPLGYAIRTQAQRV
jgi:hypothetical protein